MVRTEMLGRVPVVFRVGPGGRGGCGLDGVLGGELVIGLHGAVEAVAGLAVGHDSEAAWREAIPDFVQRGNRRAIQSDVDQAEGDGAPEFVVFHLGFDTQRAFAMVSAEGVLQPLGAVAAEAA